MSKTAEYIHPRDIYAGQQGGLKIDFEAKGFGPGYIYYETIGELPATVAIETPWGIIHTGTVVQMDAQSNRIVSPNVALTLAPEHENIETLRCALRVNGQEYESEPTIGDKLPEETYIYFYDWTQHGQPVNLIFPLETNKLEQVEVRFWNSK